MVIEGLRSWTQQHRFLDILPGFLNKLCVECTEDLSFVTQSDRRFAKLITTLNTALGSFLAPATGAVCDCMAMAAVDPTDATHFGHELAAGRDQVGRRVSVECSGKARQRTGRGHQEGSASELDDAEESKCAMNCSKDDDSDFNISGDDGPALYQRSKRGKICMYSLLQRKGSAMIDDLGTSRVRLPFLRLNRMPKATSPAAAAAGSCRVLTTKGHRSDRRCAKFLKSLDDRLAVARRTAREKKMMGSSDCRRQSVCNYARFGSAVLDVLLDGRGSWLVLKAYARECLNVSNRWLSRCQGRAIEVMQAAPKRISECTIASGSSVDALVQRFRRPDPCLLSAVQLFKTASLDSVLHVACPTEHGLSGMQSNRTMVMERQTSWSSSKLTGRQRGALRTITRATTRLPTIWMRSGVYFERHETTRTHLTVVFCGFHRGPSHCAPAKGSSRCPSALAARTVWIVKACGWQLRNIQ